MKKIFIIIIYSVFFITSCNKSKDSLKQLNFYNKVISVSNSMIIDNDKTEASLCKKNLYLKNKQGNSFISYKLCNYRYNKRESFEKLNSFFSEECEALESEVLNLQWIEKKASKDKKHYKYTFTCSRDNKYYHVTYLAYEKYYLTINIESQMLGRLNELIKSIHLTVENESLVDITFDSKECINCKFPTFW